jgi:hypothetical protein
MSDVKSLLEAGADLEVDSQDSGDGNKKAKAFTFHHI